MKKKYLIEFTHTDGRIEEVELTTDRIKWSIEQWSRNRSISSYKIISEGNSNSKKMLFG
tara:strand:+ start:458 stop:634 length:177 start_codon:yes stop_codon:yes gene_type:complete